MNPHKKAVLMHEFKKATLNVCNPLWVDEYANNLKKTGILTNVSEPE
ncbi:hypothetical protein LDJ79_19635 [Vibrio tritonius]|uniref:Uncharacterized protein n=1 Tax=Vibrio tritonius TaxID=1435069 RepID=A0ABS7YVU5_9VIBR|nr:hypothetical protein [Vibrio tritonius]MCA2018339.1 hypothetical protein [Vibrio tritonius]